MGWFEESLGAVSIGLSVSTGLLVSVGCPLTSPGFEDIPGSLLGVSFEGLGLAGRATLPEVPLSELEEEPALSRVSLVEPLLLEPVSVPEVVGLAGEAGVVGLALVSSEGGVSEGEVRVRCIPLDSLRPCESVFLCFFAFFFVVAEELEIDSFPLPFAEEPLLTLPELSLPMPVLVDAPPRLGTALEEVSLFELSSGCCWWLFAAVSPLPAVVFADGLLLGSVRLLESLFEELPGSALLFWSAGSVAVPLSSGVVCLLVVLVLVSLVPVPVLVCARAPNAERASASAANPMIFIEPP